MRQFLATGAVAIGALVLPASAQHDHALIEIGRYITNALVFHLEEPLPLQMPESMLPAHPGFAMEELAIESLQMANKHEYFPIDPNSDIRLILVSIDPGLTFYNGATPMVPGAEMVLGAPFFHITPLWTIDPGPVGGVYGARLRVRDAAGLQGDSGIFEVSFVTVPGPGGLLVLGLATAVAGPGRRRVVSRRL